jgi:hypothetical protein
MVAFNEIFYKSGKKRPAYASLEARTGIDLSRPVKPISEGLRPPGAAGCATIYPVPLILDEREYRNVLVPGVLQRALALQELFRDLSLGSARCVQAGLLTREDLENLFRSEGIEWEALRRWWLGQNPDQIRFVYGPDLVRDAQGRWQVLEDNVGCVGGVAEGYSVLETFLRVAKIRPHPERQSKPGLAEALMAFLKRVGLKPGDPNLYGIPGPSPAACPDPNTRFETDWKRDQLDSLGIIVTQPEQLLDRAIQPSALINLSATLVPSVQQMAEAIFAGREMPVFGAPAVGLVASKGFHALGHELTTFYLNEPAMLSCPRTQLLREPPDRLSDEGVLKRSNGCGGTEVYFLAEAKDRQAVLNELKGWGPCGGVLQERVSQSFLDVPGSSASSRVFVEIRPIVYVTGWKSALVGGVVAGRAVSGSGDLTGNISRGAWRLPVIRERV